MNTAGKYVIGFVGGYLAYSIAIFALHASSKESRLRHFETITKQRFGYEPVPGQQPLTANDVVAI